MTELESSANSKRCQQQRRSISSGESATEVAEEENNQFQEVASARKQRKTKTNKYSPTISKTITLNERELLHNSNQQTNNVRDFCALNNHEQATGVYAVARPETLVKNNHHHHHHHLEDNHHSSLWSSSSGNIRHYNQIGADLLSRPQLEQSQVNKGKCAPEQAAFLGGHNSLSWFQKGAASLDEHEGRQASRRAEHSSSAGGLQPPANEYQPGGYSSGGGGGARPEQAAQRASYQLLAAKVGQNVAAGGKIRGGGGSEEAASELEVEELHESAEAAAGQLEVGASKQRANAAAESNNSNEYNQLR